MPTLTLETRGEGPPVLFLHGTPTVWDVLRPAAAACTARRTLLAALPGYGASEAWPTATTAVAIAECIEAGVLAAGVTTLSIVGFSGGAYHALHVAARGVLKVDRVVSLAGLADLSADARGAFRGFAAALRAGQALDGVATARFLSPSFAAEHPDACARVEGWMRATTPENLARELDAIADAPSLLDGLAGFDGKLVARAGALDAAVPSAMAEAMAAKATHGTAQIVPGVGHALLEEDRTGTLAAVVEALR